jgi:integrase
LLRQIAARVSRLAMTPARLLQLVPVEIEVASLTEAAKGNRYGHQDATMILVAFRRGLRSSELVDLRWDQIDFTRAVLHVRRAKKGTPAIQ